MRNWDRTLTLAGIDHPRLRADYTRQRQQVAAYRRHAYAAVRLLLPEALAPHIIAATAFMHRTDTLLDGADDGTAWASWEKEVHSALATGESTDPELRPLLHTLAARPALRRPVEEFLAGALLDREFTGFPDEADYQRYVDAYSLPAFMLIATLLLAPDADPSAARRLCRAYIDGSQRLDFVNDLAEDLGSGRLTLPVSTLARHGVSREDLECGRDTAGVRSLLRTLLERAREDLLAARPLVRLTPPANRSFVRAMLELEMRTAEAALAKGAALPAGPARPPALTTLRVLCREYARRGR
ncbi:squalene/phytoene synthase family protein [Streptomyces orinoci]|uniref:Squalene/phytoene synthase family protein n=1 Tax=Streptomyces orinoci TaxID=67339 RepID=A0ABV3K6C2_STRON|nr:squalene/phytoene synthase family protein [Streptomyces orinoci]